MRAPSAAAQWIGRPHNSVMSGIRKCIYEAWAKEWNTSREANHTKGFYSGPNSIKAKSVYKLARLELGRFVRIITGHNNLNFFQTKIGLLHSPTYRFCGEGLETIKHILTECPRFYAARSEILGDRVPTADMTWSVRELINFSFTPGLNEAYEGSWKSDNGEATSVRDLDITLGMDWLEEEMADTTEVGSQAGSASLGLDDSRMSVLNEQSG